MTPEAVFDLVVSRHRSPGILLGHFIGDIHSKLASVFFNPVCIRYHSNLHYAIELWFIALFP